MSSSTQRLQQIAVMYAKHEGELRRVVHRRASSNHAIVEDACAHAWTQLLLCEDVDVRAPRWRARRHVPGRYTNRRAERSTPHRYSARAAVPGSAEGP
jgi:hypothetical protein